jgi:type I restriction enzyme S subunit
MVTNATIKKGYKQTEIGVIPEDWEVKKLGELVEVKDGTHQTPKYFDSGIPFYSVESVTNNDFTNIKYISEAEHKLLTKKFKIEEMDILMTRIGSIGNCKLITWNPNASFYVSLALLKPKNKSNAPYIYHFSKTDIFKKELEDRSLQWAIPKKINLGEISKVKICIPKEESEKTAIATVLSDTDALIEHLDKLIAKKKAMKQGTMQQLLTGKKRLPGFSGEWEVKKLGDIAQVLTGNTPPTNDKSNYGEDYFFVSPADLGKSKYIHNTEKKLSKKGFNISRKFPPNSILFTCIGSTIGKLGIAPIELTSNQQINAVLPNENFSPDFLFYSLDYISPRIQSLAGEQAVPLVNKTEFERTLIVSPTIKSEQTAIATILSDTDTEIENLEKKRYKYIMLKQGMMQQLLTGRIRIYDNN